MIQTWKEVCYPMPTDVHVRLLIRIAERPWSWMEEVAKIDMLMKIIYRNISFVARLLVVQTPHWE